MNKSILQKPKVSCIIPFWNEGQRLFNVLDEIVKCKNINEIICVDDYSDTNFSSEIKKYSPSTKYMRLNKNLGKSGAILKGLKHSEGDRILLIDADLRNVNHLEIDNAISVIQKNRNIDMLILRRIKAPLFVKLTRGDVLSTGERIVKRFLLQEVLEKYAKGWQLESKINLYMYTNKKDVFWFPHSGINTHWKWGFYKDLKYHQLKFKDIFSIGLTNLVKLFLFFGKRKYLSVNE